MDVSATEGSERRTQASSRAAVGATEDSGRRIVGGHVVTMDGAGGGAGTVLADGEVAWDAVGTLTYVGPARGPAGAGDVDATGCVVLPGLVNAHTHSGMSMLRGYSDDCDLQTWLGHVRDFEVGMSARDVASGLRLALLEMVTTGTTAFADMYHWDADLLAIVADAGLRVVAAPAVFDYDDVGYPGAAGPDGTGVLAATEDLAREFAGDDHVRLAFGPHAPYTCSPELYADVARRAARLGIGVHTHLSETRHEVDVCRERFGVTPIAHVERLGLFEVPVHVAHAVHATPEDVAILAARGASVSHNPVSNLKLGAGVAPLVALRDAGVPLALGTDSAASNNTLDLFEEIKTAPLLQRGVAASPDVVLGSEALAWATTGGARALGFDRAGALEVGKWADVVVVRADGPAATPLYDPVSFLAFAARGSDVRDVVVGGRTLVRDGRALTLDEDAILDAVARAGYRRAHDAS
ncbi:amidohydrolase family protein [Agilicoccus flavus]|uniref:amidohydrolase family protein n=1 Tax=Agilicoccus flavus TaxID=2775968 RepID=UPI001CF70F3C|nr:amidohydrolase [Agilicoccus flavus]